MNADMINVLLVSLGMVVGAATVFGAVRWQVQDARKDIDVIYKILDRVKDTVAAGIAAREEGDKALLRVERMLERLQGETLSVREYENRHGELQRQISDLKDGQRKKP